MKSRIVPIGLCLASSVLYAASFPPLGLFPLAWVALAPLLVALARVGPLGGALLGLLFSVLTGAVLASWLPGMLAGFFEMGLPAAAAASAGAYLLCGLPYAFFGGFVASLARRGAFGPGAVAAAWGCCELVRVHGPVETPWALLAYTQAPWLTLAQAADLVGAVGLGMGIAAVNACVACAFAPRLRTPRHALRTAAVAALLAAALAYGAARLAQDFREGEPISVAVVQGALDREQRFAPERRAENLEHYLALSRRSDPHLPDLILWPEFALLFHLGAEPELWSRVVGFSRERDAELLLGAPHSRHRLLVREELNSAFLVRQGRIVDRHDKFRLMPFSEERPAALPFGRDVYRPGLELRPLRSGAASLGVLLCSEALHPRLAQRLVAGGAELLANPSNDDWFATEAAADHQVAVAIFRAIENRRPVLRPSTTGRSAIVDAHGRLLALAPYREPATLMARVHASRSGTVYARLSELVPGAAAGGLVLSSILQIAVVRRRNG
jgi:apolipoprotein N-acyltransferase